MNALSSIRTEYLKQINDEIRDRASDEVRQALRRPENIEQWMLELKRMKRDTESQLSADKADRAEARLDFLDDSNERGWLEYVADRNRWRADSIRFKNGVENRLDEAIVLHNSVLNELYNAIKAHKTSIWMASPDDSTDEVDARLWDVLV